MDSPSRLPPLVANGENLSGYLRRIKFDVDSVKEPMRSHRASSSVSPQIPSSAPLDTSRLALHPRIANPPARPTVSHSLPALVEVQQRLSSKQAATNTVPDPPTSLLRHSSHSVRVKSSLPGNLHAAVPTLATLTPPLLRDHEPPQKPRHELPIYALAQTLRASSIGATMSPGISNDSSSLGYSKYAPAEHSRADSKTNTNKRTAESIARQSDIDARLAQLRSRRDPKTEQRDEARRKELVAAEKAAAEQQARLKIERDAKRKSEEEATHIEAERLKKEQEEAERKRREKEEEERKRREKEEAERRQREKEEAERRQREKEEAERMEAERLQREKDEREEAEARAFILEKIDQLEEDKLILIQSKQIDIKKEVEDANTCYKQLVLDIQKKSNETKEAKERLDRLQSEVANMKEAEISLLAKIEATDRQLADLQTESEKVMEMATTMRKELDGTAVRTIDVDAFLSVADSNSSVLGKRVQQVPKYGKTLFGDMSPAASFDTWTETSDDAVEEKSSEIKATVSSNATENGGGVERQPKAEPKVDDEVKVKNEDEDLEEGEIKEESDVDGVKIKVEEDTEETAKAQDNGNSKQQKPTNGKEHEDLAHKAKFNSWPTQENRPFGGAQVRLVQLRNLSMASTVTQVQSLVWGGRIEKIEYILGNSFAWVLFMRGEDCAKYLQATANGIEHPEDKSRIVWVEPSEPISVNEFLRGMYESGHTRCVRAVGADEDWGHGALSKLATAKNRKLERIVSGVNPSGLRVIEFRFTNIVDAGRFKIELQNDIDWEHCNVYFGTDPCEANKGVHTGIH